MAAIARVAIDAYCEAAEGLGNGTYKNRFQGLQASFDEIALVQRALQIANQIGKKGQIPDRVKENIGRLCRLAKSEFEYVPFEGAGRLRLHYGIHAPGAVAADAEELALAAEEKAGAMPLAVKRVWDLAADAHAEAKDEVANRRCRLAASGRRWPCASRSRPPERRRTGSGLRHVRRCTRLLVKHPDVAREGKRNAFLGDLTATHDVFSPWSDGLAGAVTHQGRRHRTHQHDRQNGVGHDGQE